MTPRTTGDSFIAWLARSLRAFAEFRRWNFARRHRRLRIGESFCVVPRLTLNSARAVPSLVVAVNLPFCSGRPDGGRRASRTSVCERWITSRLRTCGEGDCSAEAATCGGLPYYGVAATAHAGAHPHSRRVLIPIPLRVPVALCRRMSPELPRSGASPPAPRSLVRCVTGADTRRESLRVPLRNTMQSGGDATSIDEHRPRRPRRRFSLSADDEDRRLGDSHSTEISDFSIVAPRFRRIVFTRSYLDRNCRGLKDNRLSRYK